MPSIAFARFWQVDLTRECFLGHLDQDDMRTMRLVSQGFASTLAPILFKNVTVDFNATCFTRQARIAALTRIGEYVRQFTFKMPRCEETFLPPLLDPETLDDLTFLYEPQLHPARLLSSSNDVSSPKYGSWELNDLLVRQYPLLFHAATNTQSFVRAINTMPNLRHLRISCPDTGVQQTHRRDIVDYALISLRIAVEQANPPALQTLSLDPINSSSLYYLRPTISIGTSPASTRVWRRIKSLNMIMESPNSNSSRESTSNRLKILHTYLTTFTQLENFDFTWTGHKGPCPLSLDTEPCTNIPSPLGYFACVPPLSSTPPSLSSTPTSTRSSQSSYFEPFTPRKIVPRSPLRPVRLRNLKSMRIRNAVFDAKQASSFIHTHRKTLTDFDFESCHLRSGTWDDALSPLTKLSHSDSWKQKQHVPSLSASSSSMSSMYSGGSVENIPPILIPPSLQVPMDMDKNAIFEVPLILSSCEDYNDLQLAIRDRLWSPDDTLSAFHEDKFDLMSMTGAGVNLGTRYKGIKALRRFGKKISQGLCGNTPVNTIPAKEEQAVDNVRKLLGMKGSREIW